MGRYKATTDGKILDNMTVVGSFDIYSGLAIFPPNMGENAKIHVKSQIYDRLVERTKDRSTDKPVGKPLVEVFAQEAPYADITDRADIAPTPPPVIPPEPPMNPRLGDKTPAWMQWLGTYYPEKFKERFKGRKTHLTVGVNPHIDPVGDVPESSFGKDPEVEWR